MQSSDNQTTDYKEGSLSLIGTVALGTGVMIGAGIFSLTGQMAEMTGRWFPLAFLSAALVVAFSAYSYIKISNAYPSAGGIGMYLKKAYGKSITTAFHALLMYFSMVIAQSFLARTFGAYTLQMFDLGQPERWVPLLGVGLLIMALLVNLANNSLIQGVASVLGYAKIAGVVVFALTGLWVADSLSLFGSAGQAEASQAPSAISGFIAATALGILAFKGFTTITNSGAEVKDPHRNVGRAIVIAIAICVVVYLLVGFAVASNLSISEIVEKKDYALAAAARPALGEYAVWFTVVLAVAATAGGVIASVFAVSRMLAMLTEMKLVPHSHFAMPGSVQKHTLVYTIVLGILLTAFFDLSRIAALGIILYLIMDIAIHYGVVRHLHEQIGARRSIALIAIALDALVLLGFVYVKLQTDPLVLWVAGGLMALIWLVEMVFLHRVAQQAENQ
jgi:amino acid transporter